VRAAAAVLVAVAAVSVLAGACAAPAPPPPVPLRGEAADLSRLAGEWNGEYTSASSGRSGSIRMTLEAATPEMAFGDVLMFPARPEERPEAVNPERGDAGPQALAIRFVSVTGDSVSGTLEPYRDPACACVVSTTFSGRVRGDVIEGTFVSHGGAGYLPNEGRWRVDRKK